MTYWVLFLAVLGGVCELRGVLLMANRYLNTNSFRENLQGLFGSMVHAEITKDLAYGVEVSRENAMTTLRGLAYIAIGFSLTTAATLISAVNALSTPS